MDPKTTPVADEPKTNTAVAGMKTNPEGLAADPVEVVETETGPQVPPAPGSSAWVAAQSGPAAV